MQMFSVTFSSVLMIPLVNCDNEGGISFQRREVPQLPMAISV